MPSVPSSPDGDLLPQVKLSCFLVTRLAFGEDLWTALVTPARVEAGLARQPLADDSFVFVAPAPEGVLPGVRLA